ncbi:MAG: YlmH/Sll1252 family protein [Clostridia bacterium]
MEEYLLKARLDDAIDMSYTQTKYLGFLDPAEVMYVNSLVKNANYLKTNFWGGFDDAERKIFAVGENSDILEDFPLKAITIRFRNEDQLSHRDILGSFMAQGVNRNSVGDILTEDGRAVIFVKSELANYFLQNLTKIGKTGVKCSENIDYPLPVAFRFTELSTVIASQRLDCLIAFLMKTSREKAGSAISNGLVTVNYKVITNRSQKMQEKDKISIRGKGKFLLDTIGPLTKKERLTVKIKKYI